ncbi:hypothetical protein EYM_06605 [Ignicoccus islandicus DSM 13165]|uniref:Radical SAM core domain-containing protein n=1 Tax=Ignicoccus islandicus DSM 13165 TaxID=940295 RepID=A0A0U2MBM3_9CREN|nr:radical SAM protein [Ignicoccus islandicus]ALU12701.1 hypothetical protein EYM_06605 [Ignicoccus islandicus DSM 13165]
MKNVIKINLCRRKIREFNPIWAFAPRRGPKVALFYPAPYEVASQSLGFQLVYALLIAHGIRAERFTTDSCGFSLETKTPIKKFDFILASSSFEIDYLYLADFLKRYKTNQKVLVGGLSPMANPIPLFDLVDYVVLGEAEATIPQLASDFHSGDIEPREWLVSSTSEGGKKAWIDLKDAPLLASQFLPLDIDPPWGKGFLIEVTRGCPHKCRFCMEGWINKPFRERDLKSVIKVLREVGEPYEKVITLSLSLTDYNDYKAYLRELASLEVTGSVPSLRVDGIDEEAVELIRAIGQRTVTVAPETTLPEKSKVLGKGFNPSFLKEKINLVKKVQLKPKAYVMIVPGEHLETAKKEIENLKEIFGKETHFTVNPLIPKPWTPLQIAPIPSDREERVLIYYKKNLPNADLYPIRWAKLQAILSLATKPVLKYLDPKLPPSKQIAELAKVIDLSELHKWRTGWEPPWMNFEVADPREALRLGEESYEAWREVFSESRT